MRCSWKSVVWACLHCIAAGCGASASNPPVASPECEAKIAAALAEE